MGQLRNPRRGDGEARLIILGLDPSLSCTGWGIVRVEGSRLTHLANGQIKTDAKAPLPDRLAHLDTALAAVIADHAPESAAVEEVFVNDNPQSTLKLAHARGVVLLGCARGGLAVTEYAPRLVKKAGQDRDGGPARRGQISHTKVRHSSAIITAKAAWCPAGS